MEDFKKNIEKIIIGAVFTFFLLITCYKLTNASLWFDETIEYWYSKIMFGTLPFDSGGTQGTVNMYQRIISTYQPPLYNVVMHFWLKISDTEWWFRFFGVVMGFVGMIGIFKSVQRLSHNIFLAAGAVLFSSCTFQLVYFWQEASEYCLMLGSLCWTIYFWICLLQEVNRKNIVLFTVAAIIPVYSQYGAVFPVFVMAAAAYVMVLQTKNRRDIIEISISYICAVLFAALPLYVLFLKKQILAQKGGTITFSGISFGSHFIKEFFQSLLSVFKWNMASYYTDVAAKLILIIVLLISFIIFIKAERKCKLLIGVNVFVWIAYYVTVKIGIYGYGAFGNRYNLFFIPLWIVSAFVIGAEFYHIVNMWDFLRERQIHSIYLGAAVCFIACFCIFGWNGKIQANWGKENARGVVDAWYEQGASDKNTIVYYAADSGFAYYVKNHDAYNEQTENNVVYMYWYRDCSEEEYREYINSIYGDVWPGEIYIAGTHTRDDFNTFVQQFVNAGYVREDVYSTGGMLVRLSYGATMVEY